MDPTAQHPARTEPLASPRGDRLSTAMPPCIAAILSIVRIFLGYGKHLDQTLPDQISHPRFPTLAASFGTHDLRRILAHVQRGILRAMMLQRFLLARAAEGRDIEPTAPPEPAEPEDIEELEMKLGPPRKTPRKARTGPSIDPDHPAHFVMPTMKELESQVRRRAIGRTIVEICLDLGIAPTTCEAGLWYEIYRILTNFGGKFEDFFAVRENRKEAFQRERSKLPNTWNCDWQDQPKEAMRQILGYLLGESPPRGPPIPQQLTASL